MKVKQAVLAVLILGAACTPARAQITFGSWGRVVITPLAFSDNHSAVSAATSTWGDVASIGFSANGVSPNGAIGFFINFDFGVNIANSMPAIIGDNAKAWVKPLGLVLPEQYDMLKLTGGWFKEEELRGKIGASEFGSWILPNGSKDEDNIFQRFNATAGAHFKLEPLKWLDSPWNGLDIQGAFGSNTLGSPGSNFRAILNLLNNEDNNTISETYDESSLGYDGDRTVSAADVYKAMQIALGYRIPYVGLVRFQFIGNNRNVFRWGEQNAGVLDVEKKLVTGLQTNKDADIIEGAFFYNAIDGLKVDVGMKIPLTYTTKTNFIVYPRVVGSDGKVYEQIVNANKKEYTVQLPYVIALGASWNPSFLSSLNVTARADLSFGGTVESESDGITVTNGYIADFWLMPSYKVLDALRIGVDMAVDIHGSDTLKITGKNPEPPRTDVSKYIDFGIGPWFELFGGGARCRVGMVVMLPGSARYKYNQSSTVYMYTPILTGEPVVSIPISFTYSF
ncbi:MAG: hypothetical protein LBN21_09860 [Treponema sp.]|jgi:hypothetical protein|nr:hypothetical protein [Treponema sp.]